MKFSKFKAGSELERQPLRAPEPTAEEIDEDNFRQAVLGGLKTPSTKIRYEQGGKFFPLPAGKKYVVTFDGKRRKENLTNA